MSTRSSEDRSTDARTRTDATLKKEERAKDGAKAMMEYQAHSRMVRDQMARLKALRLAKEAAEKQGKRASKPVAAKSAKSVKSAKS